MSEPRFCIRAKSHIPPGGWRCICPKTDVLVEGSEYWDMLSKCESLLNDRGIMIPPTFSDDVDNAVCQQFPGAAWCVPCTNVKQSLNFSAIVRWVRAMYNFVKEQGFQPVTQDEADRRAKICAACPHQISTSGCWGCKGIAGMLPMLAGARKTQYDGQLKACGICGCYNSVSVHMPLDFQSDSQLNFPDHCWKNVKQAQTE